MKQKRAGKQRQKRSLKRLLLKFVWFGICLVASIVLGTAIFLMLLALNGAGNLSRNDMIAATWLATFILTGTLLLFGYLFRKKRHVLFRWTRRSFIVLGPLVFVAATATTALLLQYPNGNFLVVQQDQTPSGLAVGNAGYTLGLTFDGKLLLEATNRERGGNGKNPLTINEMLNASAKKKCEDMVAKNYWSHNDPSGTEPWHFLSDAGYQYETAEENQAYGYASETDVIQGWMKSSTHRENLLNAKVTEVGFGVCEGGNFMNQGKQLIVVQHMAKPKSAPAKAAGTSASPSANTTSADCGSLYNTYYTGPMISVGTKPTSTYLISYIGTSEYDSQVSLYNSNVAIYNSKWQQHKSNFLNEANKAKCSTGLYTSIMDMDEARPYPVN